MFAGLTAAVRRITSQCLSKSLLQMDARQGFHSINAVTGVPFLQPSATWNIPVRTKVRDYFPRPKETHRIRRHGWQTRISTPAGRRIIMRRILKGRHVLSH